MHSRGLFALQYALGELWKSWGIEPAVVLGHSLGEYAAACAAGLFSMEEALRLVARRGQLLDEHLPSKEQRGGMAVLFRQSPTGGSSAGDVCAAEPSSRSDCRSCHQRTPKCSRLRGSARVEQPLLKTRGAGCAQPVFRGHPRLSLARNGTCAPGITKAGRCGDL